MIAYGEPMVWLTGGALGVCIVMIISLLVLVFVQGVGTFWVQPIQQIRLIDGTNYMGQVTRVEWFEPDPSYLEKLSPALLADAKAQMDEHEGRLRRRLVRTGNFELTNTHFHWVTDIEIESVEFPEWAMTVERLEWGRFYGELKSFTLDGEVVATDPAKIWEMYHTHHGEVMGRVAEIKHKEKHEIGEANYYVEQARLNQRQAELDFGKNAPQVADAKAAYEQMQADFESTLARIREEITELREQNERYHVVMSTAQGQDKSLPLADFVRVVPSNRVSFLQKVGVYTSRWWEFLSAGPREANQEGGVFPAIFGTILMTLIMSIAVVPFGVLAALYLREYAKGGAMISAVRIAINNLAGVPSIVFGVFGLGFFCYIVGASLDELLFEARLPNPTFGKGGLLWASLTLALLTLPVVIVATEEALSAVPNSMREGSYACGASKWQTIKRIVLPRAMPGIMTGTILAMARGAGEVAPLMLVGAVKLAPELPGEIDIIAPYVHIERSFMHLGFHIFDVGFQSPNAEAAKPMVYTTTLLLIAIIAVLNVLAITLRTRLRRKFVAGQF